MRDIERFTWASVFTPEVGGDWVRYPDHQAEVERLKQERDDYRAEFERLVVERDAHRFQVERLTTELTDAKLRHNLLGMKVENAEILAGREEYDRLFASFLNVRAERDAAQAEVERLTARQTEMETHITGLTNELHRTRADGIELRWVADEVEQLTAQRDAARAEVERLTVELDEARAERDTAQRERDRVQDLLTLAGRELSTLRECWRVRRRGQSAKLDAARAEVEQLTAERDEAREKLTRVQVQYDEFAKVTAKVIEQHQRERDHARQQVYRLQQAGADRPTDPSATLDAATDVADVALVEHLKRGPR